MSIDPIFRDNVDTVRELQHSKGRPPVRPQSPRRRHFRFSKEKSADAKRRITARSPSNWSFPNSTYTSCQKISVVALLVLSLDAFENRVHNFPKGITTEFRSRLAPEPFDQSTSFFVTTSIQSGSTSIQKDSFRFGPNRPVDAHFRFRRKTTSTPNDAEPRALLRYTA